MSKADEERKKFETWAKAHPEHGIDLDCLDENGEYRYSERFAAFGAWQAREAEIQALREALRKVIDQMRLTGRCVCLLEEYRDGTPAHEDNCPLAEAERVLAETEAANG